MFDREKFSGAADSRLHFIGDKKNSMLAANLLQHRIIFFRRSDKAAFAKHRLGDHRPDRPSGSEADQRLMRAPP